MKTDIFEFKYIISKNKTNNSCSISWYPCQYYICTQYSNSSYYDINLNIRDNRPTLSFTYYTKESELHGLRLKKGDKLYFCNDSSHYLELDIIHTPYSKYKNEKTIDFYLLQEDIIALGKFGFKEIIIEYKDGKPATHINNFWHKPDRNIDDNPMPGSKVFNKYVNTFKKALKDAGLSFQKQKGKKDAEIIFDPCFVYLMHDSKNGYHKIGISKTPKYREKTLQSEKPVIDLICAKEYPSRKIAEAIETALHKVYEPNRIRGEWFNLTEADIIMLKATLK